MGRIARFKGALMEAKNSYVPGVCNIGAAEIGKRRRAGWIGFAATVALAGLLLYFQVPRAWRLLLFLPATLSAIGFLQARMHFCAYFGSMGVFNLGEVGKTDTVQQAEFRAKDRRKARQIILYSLLAGAVVALLAYYG